MHWRKSIGTRIGTEPSAATTRPGQTGGALPRRTLLTGAAALAGGTVLAPTVSTATPRHDPAEAAGVPLWRLAADRGLAFGTAASTRLFEDEAYSRLVDEQAAVLFTEDDLLWYKLKPTPQAPLDFSYADALFARAAEQRQLVVAAHLVWDEGFGDGWAEDDLWGLTRRQARTLLHGTADAMVERYRGRVAGWIAANEVTDPEGDRGFRTDVPWYQTIGRSYVREVFERARDRDPGATLVLNEFGFETVNEYGDQPRDRQLATLQVIDTLLAQGTPVDALGVQAHLLAEDFAERFDPRAYRRFLSEVADRGLEVLVTELDVLDDGLPPDVSTRDRAVADVYARYLDATLDHHAVKAVLTFGLSDRHTWLEEDYPREDGAARRPLPWDEDLRPKPALRSLRRGLRAARRRRPLWTAGRR
ncbi:hypothetical protein DT076_10790 [Desertihabitans brevis]|uniref:endo-1,4-beta-xylanase n=1 Tax=Desertihabitans brevis TaxID=2268447 RepID=A0A367YWI6_9ACTN|nr:endo-1,4-beta-xylanase [Desertihabitans brevis]RCK69372.1 hypothetical protein DT076_10790 [Desertihabitans brevis]